MVVGWVGSLQASWDWGTSALQEIDPPGDGKVGDEKREGGLEMDKQRRREKHTSPQILKSQTPRILQQQES